MGHKSLSVQDRKDRAKELQDLLTKKVETLTTDESWKAYLKFLHAFHSYSLRNTLLIMFQCEGATQVAGFRKWRELGRQVRKGSKAIRIYGYSTKLSKDKDGNIELDSEGNPIKTTFYPVLSVFDISQTDPIEGMSEPDSHTNILTGADSTGLWEPLTAWLTTNGWTIKREDMSNETRNGYTKTDGSKTIVIDSTLSEAATVKTLIHEAAHAVLHEDLKQGEYAQHRGVFETEAESVAYTIAGAYGMDTSQYSIGYIAGWADGNVQLVQDAAANVLRAVHTIITGLEEVTTSTTQAA